MSRTDAARHRLPGLRQRRSRGRFHTRGRRPQRTAACCSTSRDEAAGFPTRLPRLGFCRACGFVTNTAFDAGAQRSTRRSYEETQAFSPRFQAFAERAGRALGRDVRPPRPERARDRLRQGRVPRRDVRAGAGHGIGIDPACARERIDVASGRPAHLDPGLLLRALRRTSPPTPSSAATRSSTSARGASSCARSGARSATGSTPWCSSSCPTCSGCSRRSPSGTSTTSTAPTSRPARWPACSGATGFEVLDLRLDYDDQYLLIEARPAHPSGSDSDPLPLEDDLAELERRSSTSRTATGRPIERLARRARGRAGRRRRRSSGAPAPRASPSSRRSAVLRSIEYAVDINPYKHGMFMAGTGQEIVAPELPRGVRPRAGRGHEPHLRGRDRAPRCGSCPSNRGSWRSDPWGRPRRRGSPSWW